VSFNVEGFSELRCWDLATGKALPAPKLKAGVLSNLLFRPGSHEVGFSLNSEDSASDAWSADLDTGAVTRWTNRTSKPKKEIPSLEPTITRVKSFDGVSIPALVYYPDAKKFPGKRPALMIFHGGPEGQSRPGYRGSFHFYLNELGVALVYPNIRGSTGYGRKYLSLDDGVKRGDAIKDVGAILDWVAKSDRLDARRVAAYGGSYGGFMSLACLVNYAERFRCGVDNVGIANFATFLRDTSDYRRSARRLEYGDERKPEVKAFLDRISPANHADQIRSPLLIIQGKNDPRVPFTEAEQMRDAVKAKGGTVWYVMAKDEGHGFVKKTNADYQFAATILFLRAHLLD
jgi:dipeptidyl aminopeptidase/acylaminoacyl peptidase